MSASWFWAPVAALHLPAVGAPARADASPSTPAAQPNRAALAWAGRVGLADTAWPQLAAAFASLALQPAAPAEPLMLVWQGHRLRCTVCPDTDPPDPVGGADDGLSGPAAATARVVWFEPQPADPQRLAQASRDRSEFMARVSHELRTPLNHLLGFTRLLEDDLSEPLSARQRARVQHVSDGGHRLLALVDDLLDLGRLDSEAQPPSERVDWSRLVAEVVDACQPTARDAGVVLVLDGAAAGDRADEVAAANGAGPAATLPPVWAPRARLAQALQLVIEHALARTDAGAQVGVFGPQRAAVAEGVTGNPGSPGGPTRLAVRVRDGGPRLTESQHLWLFESFAPADSASTADDGGVLRLALARRLIEAMQGRIEAVDAGDTATEFRIELPAAAPAASKVALPPSAGRPWRLPQPFRSSRPLRLLCVEDNPVNMQLVCELVALRPDVDLHTADDGGSGIASARAHPPDVALLDMHLPDLSGLDVLRALRADPATAHCLCIALSADALPQHVQHALAAGFDAYWTKPIDFGVFLSELDRLCERAAGGALLTDEVR